MYIYVGLLKFLVLKLCKFCMTLLAGSVKQWS